MWLRSAPDIAFYKKMSLDPRRGRLLKAVWKHFGFFCIYVTVGATLAAFVGRSVVRDLVADARIEAYTAAVADFNEGYKQRLLENKDALNHACTTWWFDMTTKDRKLTIPRKQK